MFCSTIIPTIGRASLARAVNSILSQDFTENFEVIVVNDSGLPLPSEAWQQSQKVRILQTNRTERSVARNTGAAVAHGKYLHFLDDDDCILPGALAHFWQLAHKSNAAWISGNSKLIDREETHLLDLCQSLNGNCSIQVMAGEWMPMGSWLVNSKLFFAIGGFNPLIASSEDVDICRRIALHTDLVSSSRHVACITMGIQGSTTDWTRLSQQSRWAREKILVEPGVFSRIQASANSSYWSGRLVRVYLTSMVWNLQHKNLFTSASRAMWGGVGLISAGTQMFSPIFWRAIASPYKSKSFAREDAQHIPDQVRDNKKISL